MALELLIIADDLTGAADTAVQFSKQGIPAAVYLSPDFDVKVSPTVAAITTESRHCSKAEAYRRVTAATEKALRAGCRRFYKKIDSTFRGNAGAEIDALMTAAGVQQCALVAAYPSAGRTTRNGRQYVNGMPLHRTAFARDPREPAAESFIPAILGAQTFRPVLLAGAPGESGNNGIMVYDAETEKDLRSIAAYLDKSGHLDIAAGAAGFAEVIAGRYYPGENLKSSRTNKNGTSRSAPLLVVNGSLNEVSLNQVEQARKAGVACFSESLAPMAESFTGPIIRRLQESGCAMLTTKATEQDIAPSSRYAEHLGRIASAVAAAVPAADLAMFGGDTAFAVCLSLRRTVLYPRDEIMPGLTVCAPRNEAAEGLLILKSGGFGSMNVISTIMEYLKYS